MADFVRQVVEDSVATVTLCRADVHNAFNDQMVAEITETFRGAATDDAVRVVVLAGEGKSFCAGADLAWMQRMVDYTFDENVADAMELAVMLRAIRTCPKPVIARVHGAVFGGGVGLVAACDIAVALQAAKFCLSEVKLGLAPAVISPLLLEKIGVSAARRYALTAERFDAEEARRIGLVHEVADDVDALDARIRQFANDLLEGKPQAQAATKQVLQDVAGLLVDDVADLTARRIAELRVSTEGQEGLRAFLEDKQ